MATGFTVTGSYPCGTELAAFSASAPRSLTFPLSCWSSSTDSGFLTGLCVPQLGPWLCSGCTEHPWANSRLQLLPSPQPLPLLLQLPVSMGGPSPSVSLLPHRREHGALHSAPGLSLQEDISSVEVRVWLSPWERPPLPLLGLWPLG